MGHGDICQANEWKLRLHLRWPLALSMWVLTTTMSTLSMPIPVCSWKAATGGILFSSPELANGVVYVASGDGYAYALDASTGVHLWEYPIQDEILSSPARANGMVYFTTRESKYLYAFHLQ